MFKDDQNYRDLSDVIIDGRFIFITGSGISSGLVRKSDPAQRLPTWKGLVEQCVSHFDMKFSRDEIDLIRDVISGSPDGQLMIEAAGLVEKFIKSRDEINSLISNLLTEADNSTTDSHEAIEQLKPLGIITFNYDLAHEVCDSSSARLKLIPLQKSVQNFERAAFQLLFEKYRTPFLLKAHGCRTVPESIVFTSESYRDLIRRVPGYLFLMQDIMMSMDMIMVGFNMGDPELFEILERAHAAFGKNPRKIFFITKESNFNSEKNRFKFYNIRYNVIPILVDDWQDIPTLLNSLTKECGPKYEKIFQESTSGDLGERQSAHKDLRRLSGIGSSIAMRKLIEIYHNSKDVIVRSEAILSLDYIKPKNVDIVRPFLVKVIEKETRKRPVALALLSFADYLEKDDLKWLGQRYERECNNPLDERGNPDEEPDPKERIKTYLLYLIARCDAKFYNNHAL